MATGVERRALRSQSVVGAFVTRAPLVMIIQTVMHFVSPGRRFLMAAAQRVSVRQVLIRSVVYKGFLMVERSPRFAHVRESASSSLSAVLCESFAPEQQSAFHGR